MLANFSKIHEHESRRREEIDKRKTCADESSKSLPTLSVGTKVIVQNPITKRWDSTAVITKRRSERSYTIRNESGKFYLRNRKFLRPKIHSTDQTSNDLDVPRPSILKREDSIQLPRRSTRHRRISFRWWRQGFWTWFGIQLWSFNVTPFHPTWGEMIRYGLDLVRSAVCPSTVKSQFV